MDTGGKQVRRVAASATCLVIALLLLPMLTGWNSTAIGGQLTATWLDSSTDALGFSVERSLATAGEFIEIGTTGSGIETYTDATAEDATTYCYRVRAFNTTAYSDYSNVACATTASPVALSVVETGTGSGTVISSPSGIICGATCTGTYAPDTVVTLAPTAATGSTFTGWSGGGCSGTGDCTVTMTAAITVTATFALQPVSSTLSVVKTGTGAGTVTSFPAGISCWADCSASYTNGAVVTLTAMPATGSTFVGWNGGGCAGTGSCAVTVAAATTLTATFNMQSVTLSVSVGGPGNGVVTSTPAGIKCTGKCLMPFSIGSVVTLTASATKGSFAGWGEGGCSGKGACTITLNSSTTIKATFGK
jgi:hypothetical protein